MVDNNLNAKILRWFEAIHQGSLWMITQYLEAGIDVNVQDRDGYTALMYAAQSDNKELAQMLIAYGADVTKQNNWGCTALAVAITGCGSKDVISLLVENGAAINMQYDEPWTFPLIAAVRRGHLDIVKALLDAGADVNVRDAYCNTSLENALFEAGYYQDPEAQEKYRAIASLLISYGPK